MLKKLCELNGTSGDESLVRNFIIEEIKNFCDFSVDNLGSIIAFKKGKKESKSKVMFCAHMDEVGFIITDIDEDGYLSFSTVGGIDTKVIMSRVVKINDINGVVGIKPIHLLDDNEKKTMVKTSSLKIDIGAKDKKEALQYVQPGDYAYFNDEFSRLGNDLVVSKALDDRIGCMLLIEMIKSEMEYDTYFCFNVQEEVGLRGAQCTAYQVQSDISIILETTTASDVCGILSGDRVCVLGNGPVVPFCDQRTIYNKDLYNLAFSIAKEKNIKIQTKTQIAGGNDAGAIQNSGKGSKVLAISLPCRYIHSGSSVVKLSDIDETRKLLKELTKEIYD